MALQQVDDGNTPSVQAQKAIDMITSIATYCDGVLAYEGAQDAQIAADADQFTQLRQQIQAQMTQDSADSAAVNTAVAGLLDKIHGLKQATPSPTPIPSVTPAPSVDPGPPGPAPSVTPFPSASPGPSVDPGPGPSVTPLAPNPMYR